MSRLRRLILFARYSADPEDGPRIFVSGTPRTLCLMPASPLFLAMAGLEAVIFRDAPVKPRMAVKGRRFHLA
jgi:hypothetical protein